jgi:hypothetical protein
VGCGSIAFAAEDARVNNSDRLRALELLGKYKTVFTDKAEHTVKAQAQPISEAEYIAKLKAELACREKAKSMPDAIVGPRHDPSGR